MPVLYSHVTIWRDIIEHIIEHRLLTDGNDFVAELEAARARLAGSSDNLHYMAENKLVAIAAVHAASGSTIGQWRRMQISRRSRLVQLRAG